MSQDGADLNMKADAAMKTIVGGGEQPEKMSDADFETMIRTAENLGDGFDYGTCANRYARLCLEHLEAHPKDAVLDADILYDRVKSTASEMDRRHVCEALSGFMAGWGVNAARHILKLKSVPNPAILEIG